MEHQSFVHVGQIEFDEFARVMAGQFFRKHSESELRAAFRQFDQDNSGYIQAKELQNIMTKMGRRVHTSEIDAMIQSLDSSGDGKISFEEFARLF
jgi:calmodulin